MAVSAVSDDEKNADNINKTYKSFDLATIYREVPLDFELEDCKYMGYKPNEFKEELEELEFYSLLKKMDFSSVSGEEEKKKDEDYLN